MGGRNLILRGADLDLGRLEARDDLGALVWQAGEGARVHRRLRQRCRGVAGSLYEEHLWESEGLIANLALSEARRELQFFLQLVLYGSVAPQTAVKRRRWIRLCIHLEEQVTRRSNKLGVSEALTLTRGERVSHPSKGPLDA